MKKIYLLVLIFLPLTLLGQADVWTQLNDYQGSARQGAVSFVIGDNAYVGTGEDGVGTLRDFWKYDPVNDSWTQIADFPGAARTEAAAFTVNGKGYVGLGEDGATKYKDFYSYDPNTDNWVQIADFGGSARSSAVLFAIDDIAYVGTGLSDTDEERDFWKYDYVSDVWTQIADLNADKRREAVAFTINGKGYVSGGFYFDGFSFQLSDVQEYDPNTGLWTERIFADGINLSFIGATSFVKDGLAYICYGNKDQVVTYNPVSNDVTDLGDVLSIADNIFDPVAFAIGDNGYLGLGSSASLLSSFWKLGLPDPPAAPSNLSFEDSNPGEIRLFWNDESDDETGFSLERAIGNVNPSFAEIETTNNNITSVYDSDILPGTLYSYRVRAFNDAGFSEYSNVLEVITPNNAPIAVNLSNNSIADKASTGTLVGTFYLDDEDDKDQGSFSLSAGNGVNDADNGLFTIDGERLMTNTSIDINTKSVYNIHVTGTDLGGAQVENSFTINVKNALNESKLFIGDDGFESITTFGLNGNPLDTLFSGTSIGSFDIDEENQVIYYSDQATRSLYMSDYNGNSELLYDSIFFQEQKELIFDKSGQKIYLSNKDNDRIHQFDLATGNLTEVIRSTNGDIDDLIFDAADQTFYWRSYNGQGWIINKHVIGSQSIENFQLTGRAISSLKYDNITKTLYFISRALGVSGNEPARIASFNTTTNEFIDVSDDLAAVSDFDLDIENNRFFIAGKTTLNNVPTDIIIMSYNGTIEEVIYEGLFELDNVTVEPVNNKVYWIDRFNNMTRSNFDGSSIEIVGQLEDFIYATPYLIDVNNSKIIAVNNYILKIKNLEVGEDFTFLTESSIDRIQSLVLDVDHSSLYWVDGSLNKIFKTDLNGENAVSIADVNEPRFISVDSKGGKLIWSEDRTINMSNLDGSEVETLVDSDNFLSDFALNIDDRELIWHDQVTLKKMNLTSRDTIVIDQIGGYFRALEYDNLRNILFYVSSDAQTDIVKFNLETLEKDTLNTGGARISNLKLDSRREKVYFSSSSKLSQISYSGERIKDIVSGFNLLLSFDLFINNSAPQELILSNAEISEMKPAGTSIGVFSTVDPDVSDLHTYFLHPESPNADVFVLEGNELKSNTIFDFEKVNNYDLKIVAEDIAGDTLSYLFNIGILDSAENSVPIDIVFTQNTTLSNLVSVNTLIGSFSTVDADQDDTHTYSFFSDANTVNNNELFEIADNSLTLRSNLASFVDQEVTIQVTTTDQVGNSFTKDFALPVDMITGLDDDERGLKIYPVPAKESLSVEYLMADSFELRIISMNGKQVLKRVVTGNSATINTSEFGQGMYILNIKSGTHKEVNRIILID